MSKPRKSIRITMTMLLLVPLSVGMLSQTSISANTNNFSDVPPTHHYYKEVSALSHAGVVNGDGSGEFNPGQSMSRAAVAEMLAKALDLEPATNNPFQDVSDDHWASESISALHKAGIVQGDDQGNYKPGEQLSRAAIAEMVVKAYDLEMDNTNPVTFDDVREDDWFSENVNILASHNLVQGNGEGQYSPRNDMQRQYFAKLAYDTEVKYGTLEAPEEEMTEEQALQLVSENFKNINETYEEYQENVIEQRFDRIRDNIVGETLFEPDEVVEQEEELVREVEDVLEPYIMSEKVLDQIAREHLFEYNFYETHITPPLNSGEVDMNFQIEEQDEETITVSFLGLGFNEAGFTTTGGKYTVEYEKLNHNLMMKSIDRVFNEYDGKEYNYLEVDHVREYHERLGDSFEIKEQFEDQGDNIIVVEILDSDIDYRNDLLYYNQNKLIRVFDDYYNYNY